METVRRKLSLRTDVILSDDGVLLLSESSNGYFFPPVIELKP